ncbi:hypothetical protein [Paraburkholderia dilworthii]|uniref:hypothetical protein n=1 Tax=Paraburkholderia dilworthii TaxID=948106 RepID=UPI000486CF6A|nr:hypothetical protein [Paraburkholderia dilworthii]
MKKEGEETLSPPGLAGEEIKIGDREFIDDVGALKEVHSFLLKQGVATDTAGLGPLRSLVYEKKARPPNLVEWEAFDHCSHGLYSQLTPDLRLRFLATQAPSGIVRLAIGMALLAILSCTIALVLGNAGVRYSAIWFAIWAAALGVLGAVAFVSMNVLAIQNDITFDFSNKRLTWLRIALGGLFGLVITFPVGYPYFVEFISKFSEPPSKEQMGRASFLLLPFVLGFSTTVVIAVLGRLMQGVQALFGTLDVKPTQTPPPNTPPPNKPPGRPNDGR